MSSMQAYYLLGVALRHKEQYEESCRHLERALEAAIEEQDAIKDEIWRELAACKYAHWQQRAESRRADRARFRRRVHTFMDSHFAAHPEVRPRAAPAGPAPCCPTRLSVCMAYACICGGTQEGGGGCTGEGVGAHASAEGSPLRDGRHVRDPGAGA